MPPEATLEMIRGGGILRITCASDPSVSGDYRIYERMREEFARLRAHYNKFGCFPDGEQTVLIPATSHLELRKGTFEQLLSIERAISRFIDVAARTARKRARGEPAEWPIASVTIP